MRTGLLTSLLGSLWIGLLAATTFGQSPPGPPERSAKLDFLTDKAKAIRVHPVGQPEGVFVLQESPLFRWQNPISGANGAIFVWTSGGRPMVVGKVHVNDKNRGHIRSYTSLARQPFLMTGESGGSWTTPGEGITPTIVTDVAAPAATENARLVQMRAIARRFRMQSTWGEQATGDWELRLLPTPMMRYANSGGGLLDGAIFGYAQGTNPEAIVVIEAVEGKEGTTWQAAPARLSGYPIRGSLDGRTVLETPRINVTRDNETYRYVYEQLFPYPFSEEPVAP